MATLRIAAAALLALAFACAPAARASEDTDDLEAAESPPAARTAERQAFVRAKLATALAQLAPIRLMMTEHYMTMGAWPASAAEIGLDPETLTSSVIAGVSLAKDGTIVAKLSPELGADVTLRLAPEPVMGGTSLEWRCRVNLAPSLLRAISCEAAR
jgi:hypothetical protein